MPSTIALNRSNPYGAVPEALNQTRLTIRDVVADYLKSKALESQLSLAKGQIELDRMRMDADTQRSRMDQELRLGAMQQNALHQDRTFDQQAENNAFLRRMKMGEADLSQRKFLEEQGKNKIEADKARAVIDLYKAQADKARGAEDRANRADEVRPLGAWAKEGQIDPRVVQAMGYNLDTPLSRAEARDLRKKAVPMLPHIAMQDLYRVVLEAEDTLRRNPDLPPDQREALKTRHGQALEGISRLLPVVNGQTGVESRVSAMAAKLMEKHGMDAREALEQAQLWADTAKSAAEVGQALRQDPKYWAKFQAKNAVDPLFDEKVGQALTDRLRSARSPQEREKLQKDLKGFEEKMDYAGMAAYLKLPLKTPPGQAGGSDRAGKAPPLATQPAKLADLMTAARANRGNRVSAMGIDTGSMLKEVVLRNPSDRLIAIERDYRAGALEKDQYEKMKRKALEDFVTQAAVRE